MNLPATATKRGAAWFLSTLLLTAGCGAPPGGDGETSPEPREKVAAVMQESFRPGDAPTPFTAAQIRVGCPAGRVTVMRIEVPGRDPFMRTFRFLEGDEEWSEREATDSDLEGNPLRDPVRSRTRWSELQSHASFPEASTIITEETVTTPAGTFDCLLYTVTEASQGQERVRRFWFAKELPGFPIRIQEEGPEEISFAWEMVRNQMP